MNSIKLPGLKLDIWKKTGCKNFISHRLFDDFYVNFNFEKELKNVLIFSDGKNRYGLTCSKTELFDYLDFVILTNKKPTLEKLEKNEIIFKKWLKHPKIKQYSNDDIINSWNKNFTFQEEDKENNINGLRKPQIGSIYAGLSHIKTSKEIGTIVLPTGTGKTETMLSLLIAGKLRKLLVVVPTSTLRLQLFDKFLNLGLLEKFEIINNNCIYPKVGILKEKFSNIEDLKDFLNNSNVIVATMDILTEAPEENQKFISEACTNIFIDEAHHTKASTWDNFCKKFSKEKILQFTATPFRNDNKRLDGKIIFNFSLKEAQQDGYFTKINFIPVKEYDSANGDLKIAEVGVKKLRDDLNNNKNHILMARCENKNHAKKVFEIYKKHGDLNPVLVYSNIKGEKNILENIKDKKHRIIVAVDMLGEGFDLPELKIACFHYIRKSLPITLQLAGRFTRTKYDEELGEATFIANIADIEVGEELDELYSQNSDWNKLLGKYSDQEVNEKLDFEEFISGFTNIDKSYISLQNINMPLSTLVYKIDIKRWHPEKFAEGFAGYEKADVKFYNINEKEKILVIVYTEKDIIDWSNSKNIYGLKWKNCIVYWNENQKLIYISSTDKNNSFKKMIDTITNSKSLLVNKMDVFKTFHNIKRKKLHNIGLKEFLGRDLSYRQMVGRNVEEALSMIDKKKGQKAFVFGVGYENGENISLGCSYKGRIWSLIRGNIFMFKNWCDHIGSKLIDETIDSNQVLKDTLLPKQIDEFPSDLKPILLDWNSDLYLYNEATIDIEFNDKVVNFSSIDLSFPDLIDKNNLEFHIITEYGDLKFNLKLSKEGDKFDFIFENKSGYDIYMKIGKTSMDIKDFLYDSPLRIWFADGSALEGNDFTKFTQEVNKYKKDSLITYDWSDVDLSKESQGVDPKISNSIQYYIINKLKASGDEYDIIYDDDYSGEIADIVTIKNSDNSRLLIKFFHLKFAIGGKISNEIKNFYEVCGQAQKSVNWKHKSGKEFISHLLRRIKKKENGKECSRLEKGTKEELEKYLDLMKKRIPVEIEIYIVQPALSKSNPSDEILTILGVTENYLMEIGGIKLKVIVSN